MDTKELLKESSNNLLLLIATVVIFFMLGLIFNSPANAEVVIAPSSYIYDGTGIEITKGQPEYVDGNKVEYETLHTIPISPTIKTDSGERFEIKTSKCPGQGNLTKCKRRFMGNL